VKRSARPLRVLFTIAGLPAGGAERQFALLVAGLDRQVVEPGLLIFNSTQKVHYSSVLNEIGYVRALGLSGGNIARLAWPLLSGVKSAIDDFAPDVVFTSLNVANHVSRLSKLLYRWPQPIITSVRTPYRDGYRKREKIAERLLWRQSSMIVCNSALARDEMIADLGIPPSRIEHVPNGIDPAFFGFDGEMPQNWPQQRVALTIGRFVPTKNHLGLLAALIHLGRRNALGDWHFVWIGEGPLENDIRTAIAETSLGDRITILQPTRDPRPFYRGSELIILPSRYEGMPNVALEAQASGRPVAISASANSSGVVSPLHGYILTKDLTDDLARILSIPTSVLALRGQAASDYIAAEYGVKRMVNQTQNILMRFAR
jgi:glycosyltransferase involved in cell wall biosynthesis